MAVGADTSGDHRVHRPHQRRQQRQQISQWIDGQPAGVEADEADARHSHPKAHKKTGGKPALLLADQPGEHGGEEGGGGDDQADVGGHGVGQGHIFQQKVEGDTAGPGGGIGELLAPVGTPHGLGVQQTEGNKTRHKPQEQNFNGRETAQKNFGGDKGGAPDHDGGDGRPVAQTGFGFHMEWKPRL